MDPEQVRAEMRATRERIDRKLDLLQARVADSRGQATKAALAGGALLSFLYTWAKLRQARQRSKARARVLARASRYADDTGRKAADIGTSASYPASDSAFASRSRRCAPADAAYPS